jgi:hypothetical protein
VNTAAAPAWRLDFDGAELGWARPVAGAWQLRFAAVPAQALHTADHTTATAGHALGVVLTLQAATLGLGEPTGSDPGTLIGRCRALQWWPDGAAGPQPLHLPGSHVGPGRLDLWLAQRQHEGADEDGGDRACLSLRGATLDVQQPDGPRWLEHLHC